MKLRAWIHMVVTSGLLLGPWAGGLRLRPSIQAAPSTATWYVKPGDPTAWAWVFGDGGSSTVQHPTYTYETAGTFAVTLTVSNAHGSDTLTMPDYIAVMEGETIYLPLVLRNAGTR
jgi:hypothetical protein